MDVRYTTGEGSQIKIGWLHMWVKGVSEFSSYFADVINE